MLKEHPRYKSGELKKIYVKLPKKQKEEIDIYVQYRAGTIKHKTSLENCQRELVSWLDIFKKDYKKFTQQDITNYATLLNQSDRTDNVKNHSKVELKKFLKWKFPDYSLRFPDLGGLRTKTANNEEKINSDTILKKEDIESIMKTEPHIYWKTFFICLYETGMRPKELRTLKWENIKLNTEGDLSEINIFMTKNKKAKMVYVQQGTHYLKKLREDNEKAGIKSIYVFPMKRDHNKPTDKSSVWLWLHNLSKKAIGREVYPYILRHTRASELYELAEKGKISKDSAIRFMGHSDDMSKVYTHLSKDKIKELTKSIYNFEDLPPERKHELELQIEALKKELEILKQNSEIKIEELQKKIEVSNKLINETILWVKNYKSPPKP